MIVTLARGAARSLFTVGMLLAFAAFLALYGAYRLVRATLAGAPAQPRLQATYGLLVAVAMLARSMQMEQMEPRE